MIEKITLQISQHLTVNGYCGEDDQEVVAYGLSTIFSDILQIIILLVVAIPLKAIPEMAVFALFYGAVRPYIGGAHANSHFQCLVIFTAVAIVAVEIVKYIPVFAAPIIAGSLAMISLIVIFWRAPVTHPNVPKSPKSIIKLRKKGRVIISIEFVCIVICSAVLPDSLQFLAAGASLGVVTAAVTLLIPLKSEREDSHE